MDKNQYPSVHSQPVDYLTGYPGDTVYPTGGYYPQTAYPGVNPGGGNLQDGNPPQSPNPGFNPSISEQNNTRVTINPGYTAGDFGESGRRKTFDFTNKTIRKAFIRKVYTILMAQLLVTISFMTWFLFHKPTKWWVRRHKTSLFLTATAPMIVFFLVLVCCKTARRTFPMNFILLGIFTVSMSVILGIISSLNDTDVVLLAVGITAAVCLALTLFALQTKWDFTTMGGVLCVCLTALILFGLLCSFVRTPITNIICASLGAILFSFYLIYDTQRIMGGDHKYTITPEEYIFAALVLYMDVINIFLKILRLIKAAKG